MGLYIKVAYQRIVYAIHFYSTNLRVDMACYGYVTFL